MAAEDPFCCETRRVVAYEGSATAVPTKAQVLFSPEELLWDD